MKKGLLLATTVSTAAVAITSVGAAGAEDGQKKRFEFLVGLNTGLNIGKYGGKRGDFYVRDRLLQQQDVWFNVWNATGSSDQKFAPFIEAELATQYLVNNTFIGINIGGGAL